VGIILLVVLLTPLDDDLDPSAASPDDALGASPQSPGLAVSAAVQTQATIRLAIAPSAVDVEELRAELEQLASGVLTRFPDRPDALHVVALLYRDLQKTTEAERIWLQCLELAPEHAGPYIGLATASMELGKDQSAVQTLQRALDAGCSTSDLYYQLGVALSKLGRLEEAAARIGDGLAQFPDSAASWLQLGQLQLQLGQLAEAEESLKKALAAGTDADSVYFSLSTVCARQGKQEEAARYRQEFQQRRRQREEESDDPFQERYTAELRRIGVASLARAGTVCEQHGDVAQAERLLLRAQQLDPDSLAVCGELALFYRRQQRPADALVVQRHLAQIDPGNTLHFVNLASLALQVGDYALAESALQQVISMRPDASLGYSGLAQLYLQVGRVDQARWFAQAALRQKPSATDEIVRTSLVLAAACRQLGDHDAAAAALEAARQAAPDDPRLAQPAERAPRPGVEP
jgi:tetratricopeptide (TPR) repeat protein